MFFSVMEILKFSIRVLLVMSNLLFSGKGFVPADRFLINCGSPSDFSVGDFTYVSDDSASRYLSTARNILADANPTPPRVSRLYRTARIFPDPARYTFPITRPGRLWIRLHFYPFPYQIYNMSAASFSVFSQQTTLLSNFTAGEYSVREYSVNATAGDLAVTISPSPGSFAFLNALEIISVPDELITNGAYVFDLPGRFDGLPNRALETVARLNMGGPAVQPTNDPLGRAWASDRPFLIDPSLAKNASNLPAVQYSPPGATPEIAPPKVYGTCTKTISNVTWRFRIDPGFRFLIRFHFCDIVSLAMYQLRFDIYIHAGDSLVVDGFDPSGMVGRLATPYYVDFVTPPTNESTLNVRIGPARWRDRPNAFLNGLEIMKLLSTSSSVLPEFPTGPRNRKLGPIIGPSVSLPVLGLLLVAVLFFFGNRRKTEPEPWVPISGSSYRIPFVAIEEATGGFDESRVIGVGGFGKVYIGGFRDGSKVAVKRADPRSRQGLTEFRTEIEMLSRFRHRHLVSLIGYCDERNEMILVYEYMEKGSLKESLYGSSRSIRALGWKERVEICIGAARGLHYLHTGYTRAIIHRDVKSANILLDGNLMAKVADFGLSKTVPEIEQSHVSTAVKGSFGYLDPEYFRRQQLTEKSDVYSFGVVLFEVVCARPVIDPSLLRERVNLAEWAMTWQRKGKLGRIIDPELVGKVGPESLGKFGETAEKCLADLGVDRPSMVDVLWNLEYALRLQDENGENVVVDQIVDGSVSDVDDSGTSEVRFQKSSMDDSPMSSVFSQLVKSEGR